MHAPLLNIVIAMAFLLSFIFYNDIQILRQHTQQLTNNAKVQS